MKKGLLVLFTLFVSMAVCFTDEDKICIPDKIYMETVTPINGNLSYTFVSYSSKKLNSNADYFFGVVEIQSEKEPKYIYNVPIYAIKIDKQPEEWMFISKIEFKDKQTITITDGENHIFELNINTFEVKCINTKNNLFKFVYPGEKYECISGNVNKLYEKNFEKIVTKNAKNKYTGTQSEVKKLTKLEDIVNVAEQALFEIYGKDNIRDEQPYRISKYKNKWIVQGSLQKENLGGVFEIIINAETSQIESVIHGE